ncbi:hypothetical protein [Streptomyces orinoci]|uniref:Lipoprotein n=1 Tax=Streptomyces orinoci TaxID=67339 RepID=A0ABV3JSG9_STRON|nr:hypothetical protein [Streptomyces orinoci]
MRLWQSPWRHHLATAVSTAAVLALTVSACGSDDSHKKADGPATGHSAPKSQTVRADNDKPVTSIKGPQGIVLDITSATRDAGGFVTVNGNLRNTGSEDFTETQAWTGPELAVIRGVGGSSLGGATLVDEKEKKRYYTLRDTENRPLASAGLAIVNAKSEQQVYMQFPAPPKSTTQVDIQIPTFQSAVLKLTDG